MGKWKVLIPTDAVNLCINPSAEVDAAGWTTGGTNTIAASNELGFRGLQSLKVTYSNDSNFARYAITLPQANTTYFASLWVYSPESADQVEAAFIEGEGFASGTITKIDRQDNVVGSWVRLSTQLDVLSDVVGFITLKTGEAMSGTPNIYLDAVMIIESTVDISYVDGDQEDCEWLSIPHGSKSQRPVTSRAGGQIADLEDDLGFYVQQMDGIGMPSIRNLARSRGHLDGAEFERTVANPRIFRLTSRIAASSLANLHSLRRAFLDIIKPDDEFGFQPVIFQYEGADVVKRIKARYDSGFEFSKGGGFSELAALQFISHEPFFYGLDENPIAFSADASEAHRYAFGKVDGAWTNFGLHVSTGGPQVNAIVKGPDGKIYFGGDFTNWNNVAGRQYIARWNPEDEAWETVGSTSDLNAKVTALAVGPDGLIYIGGTFTNAGGVGAADYLATLDPDSDTWGAVGVPAPTAITGVYAIAFSNNKMYVGGDFQNWTGGATALDYIVEWNGTTWNDMDNPGTTQIVKDIAVAPNGDIWVCGSFTNLSGVSTADFVAYWDGSNWNGPASDVSTTVEQLLIDQLNGDVYAFGDFTSANSASVGFLKAAKFSGVVWEKMPGWEALNSLLAAEWMDDGRIMAGGRPGLLEFAADAAIWNGSSWRSADFSTKIDLGGDDIRTILIDGDDWYFGTDGNQITRRSNNFAATNEGSSKAYPVFKFWLEGTGANNANLLWIANETTGTTMYFNYQFTDGEILTIDTRPGRRTAISSMYGEIWPFLPGSNITDFYLKPGTNNISAWIGAIGGTPTINAAIQHVNQFWSVD